MAKKSKYIIENLSDQPDLFGSSERERYQAKTAQVAAVIATHAAPVAHARRVSEAARDQGWQPHDATTITPLPVTERDPHADPYAHYTGPLYEMPGDGQNHPWNRPLSGPEIAAIQAERTPEDRAAQPDIDARGAALARAAWQQAIDRQNG